MKRHLIGGAAAALALALGLAGCGGQVKPSPQSVSWAGHACATVKGVTLYRIPALDRSDYSTWLSDLGWYMGVTSAQYKSMGDALSKLGPPPVAAGPRSFSDSLTNLRTLENVLQAASDKRAGLRTVGPAHDNAMIALADARRRLDSYKGPIAEMKSNPALRRAFGQSPVCKHDGLA